MKKKSNSTAPDEIWHPENQGIGKTQLQHTLTDTNRSALKKYQEVVTGSTSILNLARYEFITTLFSSLPGAAGLLLRKIFFKRLFGQTGDHVILGRSITLRHPHKVNVGNNVVIDDYAVIDAKGTDNRGIVIGDGVLIGRNTVISCKNGDITIGDNSNVAMNCFIQSAKNVSIGENVLFSAFCYVIGGGDHKTDQTDIPIIAQGQVVKGIKIEDNCLLGAGVMIQDGVTIGKDAIVGTGSVVRDDIPPFAIAAGAPAKVIKTRL